MRNYILLLLLINTVSFRPAPTRVLFIGNSLTYANDLPAMLAGLDRNIEVAMVAHPNLALIDHLNGESDAVARITGARWDFVVLQQGPTSMPIDRDTLVIAVRGLDRHIRATGARTVIYMVWPSRERLAHFDDVLHSHRIAAESVGALLVPAGAAWRAAWRLDAQLALYDVDGFHPSPLGSYLAALTFYECLTGRDARSLPPNPGRETTIKVLQAAAHEAASTCAIQAQREG